MIRLLAVPYRALVRALPRCAREGVEEEMVRAFELAASDPRRSFRERAHVVAGSFGDLARCIAREWSHSLRRPRSSGRPRPKETVMSAILQDVRQSFRLFRNRPGFVAIVVLTLGLGIGAVTAVFTVVDAVLLRPLPYTEPERLALLWGG